MSLLVRNNEIGNECFAALSLCGSLSVVLTGVVFPRMWDRLFMHIIFFISLSDVGTSLAAFIGYPADGTVGCTAQAFLVSFFIKCTLFWNVMLCCQLYQLVIHSSRGFSFVSMHAIVWLSAGGLAVLPLTTSTYGREGPNTTVEWCFLHEKNIALYIFWNALDWMFIMGLMFLFMVYMAVRVRMKVRSYDSVGFHIYRSLALFPAVLFLTYCPIIIANMFVYCYEISVPSPTFPLKSGVQTQLLSAVSDLALLYGFSLAIIFYWKSPEARHRWKALLCGVISNDIRFDFDERHLVTPEDSGSKLGAWTLFPCYITALFCVQVGPQNFLRPSDQGLLRWKKSRKLWKTLQAVSSAHLG
jgi:hypothetical protein